MKTVHMFAVVLLVLKCSSAFNPKLALDIASSLFGLTTDIMDLFNSDFESPNIDVQHLLTEITNLFESGSKRLLSKIRLDTKFESIEECSAGIKSAFIDLHYLVNSSESTRNYYKNALYKTRYQRCPLQDDCQI